MSRHACSRRERSSRQAGFTLIEALAAMIILIFGIMAVSNLIVVAISSNRIGSTTTAASGIATETLERLKAIKFNDLTVGGSLTADVGTANCQEPPTGTTADCVVAGNFNSLKSVTGVGRVKTRWVITQVDNQTLFIKVRSESEGLAAAKSRAEFTTIRSCTAVTAGCPAP